MRAAIEESSAGGGLIQDARRGSGPLLSLASLQPFAPTSASPEYRFATSASMAPPAAPFSLELIRRKLVKPRAPCLLRPEGGHKSDTPGVPSEVLGEHAAATVDAAPAAVAAGQGRTALSSFDSINALLATARACGFGQEAAIDPAVLEAVLELTVTDRPFLAGRLGGMRRAGSLGSLAIEHTGEGALLTVVKADEVLLSCMSPATWPQRRMALADQEGIAFYIDSMDTGRAMLTGREPLMKVRLTQLKDSQILGITLSHVLTDGNRWPLLERHLAARYRQLAEGAAAPEAGALLRPADRGLLCSEHMAAQLLGKGAEWAPPPSPPISASLAGYWRLAKQAWSASRRSCEFVMIHLPRSGAAALKAMAAEASPVPGITTGDAEQAAVSLLLHAALGRPLLPVAPKAMAIILQVPLPAVPAGQQFFGNAVRMLDVSLPAGTPQPEGEEVDEVARAALGQLAGAIRRVSADFRSRPEAALDAMHETEQLVGAPLLRMLGHMCARLLPHLQSATNFNPAPQTLDLGLGQPLLTRQVSVPRARDIAIIRTAVPPFSEGLFIQVCLKPKAADRLRHLALLPALMSEATFVGPA